MSEKMITSNGIEICTETFGNPNDVPILLVMGAASSMLMWREEFIDKLVDGGRFVIRYDNRDTGKSSCFDFEQKPYTLSDMAADAVGVLDAYDIKSVHAVGASLGGCIVQHLALDHHARVRTITPIMSSSDPAAALPAVGGDAGDTTLPPPTDEWVSAVAELAGLDPDDISAAIKLKIRMLGMLHGSAYPFPEAQTQELVEAEVARARDYPKANNHVLTFAATPSWVDRLQGLDVPTLVIHGTEDIILPYPHAKALAGVIAGAKLLTLEGVGHSMPEEEWGRITRAILEHTSF
jgi:pimeloyl-ACP methyl ester carboxylesterase